MHFTRPSIDVLFETTAVSLREQTVAVLLSGANADGASGMHRLQLAGAVTIVQSPETASSRTMPEAALHLFKPTWLMTPGEIGKFLNKLD